MRLVLVVEIRLSVVCAERVRTRPPRLWFLLLIFCFERFFKGHGVRNKNRLRKALIELIIAFKMFFGCINVFMKNFFPYSDIKCGLCATSDSLRLKRLSPS